jgi:hypothetical protein
MTIRDYLCKKKKKIDNKPTKTKEESRGHLHRDGSVSD